MVHKQVKHHVAAFGKLLSFMTLLACVSMTMAMPVGAQIRGPSLRRSIPKWWFSGGANAVTPTEIHDGHSETTWTFGNDPLWQFRGTLEKAIGEDNSIGLAVAYGNVDFTSTSTLLTDGGVPPTVGDCVSPCRTTGDLWSAMILLRSSSRYGLHSVVELSGGVTTMRNVKTKVSRSPLPDMGGKLDLTGTLGGGLQYGFRSDWQVFLVQDFGIGYHSKENLPDGTSRTWRVRDTRIGLRFGFGEMN